MKAKLFVQRDQFLEPFAARQRGLGAVIQDLVSLEFSVRANHPALHTAFFQQFGQM